MLRTAWPIVLLWGLLSISPAMADGPADNNPETVRRIPKLGVELTAEQKEGLQFTLNNLRKAIDDLRKLNKPRVNELLPDIEIFHKAVNDALQYQEFFDPADLKGADKLLQEAFFRAHALAKEPDVEP